MPVSAVSDYAKRDQKSALASVILLALLCGKSSGAEPQPLWREALMKHLPSLQSSSAVLDVHANTSYPEDTRWWHPQSLPHGFGCGKFYMKSFVAGLLDQQKYDNVWAASDVTFFNNAFHIAGSRKIPKVPGATIRAASGDSHDTTYCTDSNTLAETWYVFEPYTEDNLYHAHNNNLFPLYRGIAAMGDTVYAEASWIAALLGTNATAATASLAGGACRPSRPTRGKSATHSRSQSSGRPNTGVVLGEAEDGADSAPGGSSNGDDVVTIVLGSPNVPIKQGKLLPALLRHLVPRVIRGTGGVSALAGNKGGVLCLKRVLFGRYPRLFSPSFPLTAGYATEHILSRYRLSVLSHLGLLDTIRRPVAWPPRVVFVTREGSTRTFASKQLLQNSFRLSGVEVEYVNPGKLSIYKQIELVANTDVLIGVHGAGLTLCSYLRPGSICFQVKPCRLDYWEDSLFTRIAELNDVGMLGYQERCKGSESWNKKGIAIENAKDKTNHHVWTIVNEVLIAYVKRNSIRDAGITEEFNSKPDE